MQVICNSRHEYRMNNFVNIQGNNIKYVSDVQDWILGDDSGHEEATCYTYSYICSDEKKITDRFCSLLTVDQELHVRSCIWEYWGRQESISPIRRYRILWIFTI